MSAVQTKQGDCSLRTQGKCHKEYESDACFKRVHYAPERNYLLRSFYLRGYKGGVFVWDALLGCIFLDKAVGFGA